MSVLLTSGMSAPMSKHTPGPWAVCRASDSRASVRLGEAHYYTAEMSMGDARLIAAAPDLLAALKAILPVATTYIEKLCPGHNIPKAKQDIEDARAAIAKAEGVA